MYSERSCVATAMRRIDQTAIYQNLEAGAYRQGEDPAAKRSGCCGSCCHVLCLVSVAFVLGGISVSALLYWHYSPMLSHRSGAFRMAVTTEMATADKANDYLMNRNAVMVKRIEDIAAEEESYKASLDKAQKDASRAQERAASEAKRLEQEETKWRKKYKEASLQEQMEEKLAEGNADKLEDEEQKYNALLEDKNKALLDLGQFDALETELNATSAKDLVSIIEAMQKQTKELQAQLQAQKTEEASKLQALKTEEASKLEALQKQLDELKLAEADKVAAARKEGEEMASQNATNNTGCQQQVKDLTAELDTCKHLQNELIADERVAENATAESQAALNNATQQASMCNEHLQAKEQEMNEIKAQMTDSATRLASEVAQVTFLKSQMNQTSNASLAEEAKEVESLKAQLVAAQGVNKKLLDEARAADGQPDPEAFAVGPSS